jgi:hypothetical protein
LPLTTQEKNQNRKNAKAKKERRKQQDINDAKAEKKHKQRQKDEKRRLEEVGGPTQSRDWIGLRASVWYCLTRTMDVLCRSGERRGTQTMM